MKYLKLFEFVEYPYISYYIYEDSYLKLHKIKHDVNKGKIRFEFCWHKDVKKNGQYVETWNKASMMLGCAKILDTKYEKMSIIRDLEIEGPKFRRVPINTVDGILGEFSADMGYDATSVGGDPTNIIRFFPILRKNLETIFTPKLEDVAKKSKDLGEVLDGLKKVRNEFFEYQKEHFDEWHLKIDINKYNL